MGRVEFGLILHLPTFGLKILEPTIGNKIVSKQHCVAVLIVFERPGSVGKRFGQGNGWSVDQKKMTTFELIQEMIEIL